MTFPPRDKSKKVVVMASGGYDSLALMLKNLELGHCVYPVYVDFSIDVGQKECEKKALRKQIDEISTNYFVGRIGSYAEIEMPWLWTRLGIQQPQPLVSAAFLAANGKFDDVDEVQFGYVIGDHAVSYLREIKDLYAALAAFGIDSEYAPVRQRINPDMLSFPLLKIPKIELQQYLSANYGKIAKYAWTCERPIRSFFEGEAIKPSSFEKNLPMYPEKDEDWIFDYLPCGSCTTCESFQNSPIYDELLPRQVLDYWKFKKEKDKRKPKILLAGAVSPPGAELIS